MTQAGTTPDTSVALLLPRHTRRRVLSVEAEASLRQIAEVREPAGESLDAAEVASLIEGASVALTGWGTPSLVDLLRDGDQTVGLIAHTAGTIRHLVPEERLGDGLRVSHAAGVIAGSVAELVVGQAITLLRQVRQFDEGLRRGEGWHDLLGRYPGHLLGSQTVGVVGSGYVGQRVIQLLLAFGCRVVVADPYLTDERAAELGVERVELDELFRQSQVVTLHAPVLPSTIGMVGAAQLALLRDGAVFMNIARAAIVDDDALVAELRTGRFRAVLDVFPEEPIPSDSPYLTMDNVVVTPHIGGRTEETNLLQGQAMVEEIGRYLQGQPLQYEVTPAMWQTMA